MSGKADIKLGYTCNNRCIHCVIADQRDRALQLRGSTDRTTQEYVSELLDAKRRGLSDVIFTGGEPTIRKDLLQLMHKARTLGLRVHVQTNGRILAYRAMVEKAAPLQAIWCVALHGPTAAVHDGIVGIPGAFDQTLRGLQNLREFKQHVLGKVVISKLNVPHLAEIVGLLASVGAEHVNLAFPHALGSAREHFDEVVPTYTDLAPELRRAVAAHASAIEISIEAVPPCVLPGHKKHLTEYEFSPRHQPAVHTQLDMETSDWHEARREQKQKGENCQQCRYDAVCEGPWKEYVEHFGAGELVPLTA